MIGNRLIRWRWFAVALLALCASPWVRSAPEANFHFRPSRAPAAAVGADLLTPRERAFVASLPEVRVGIPSPPERPYETIEGDEVAGIHVEMLQSIAAAFGIRLKPVVLPSWSALLQAARDRRVDLVTTLGVTPGRLEYLEFTLGVTPLNGALFARPDTKLGALATARFVVERDYLAADFIRREYPRASVLEVDGTVDALRAVRDGRADVYLGALLETTDALARAAITGVVVRRMMPYGTGYYHFAVRKDWTPLAGILNKGIQAIRSTPATAGYPEFAQAMVDDTTPAVPLTAAQRQVLARHAVWRIGAVRGLPLLNDVDARGVHSGIAAEYTEQIARRLGVGVQVVPFDNVSAMLQGLRRQRIDLIPFLTRTPEREREFAFSAPYVEMPYELVARSDGPLYWGLETLRGHTLALAQDHPLRGWIAREAPDIHIVDVANGNEALDRVARGEADAAVEVKLFANLRINSDPYGRLRALGPVGELPASFHFAALRGHAELLPLVDAALATIPPDERRRMLLRWVAIDLPPEFHWRRYLPLLNTAAAALILLALSSLAWTRRLQREVRGRRRSEELLTDIATTVPGIAFREVFDARGDLRQLFTSASAGRLLGIEFDPSRSVLANLADRVPAEAWIDARTAHQRALQTGEPLKAVMPFEHPDGRTRWLQLEAVRTRAQADVAAWTGYLVDVSSERELQSALASAATARHLMLASASHELRAPTHALSLALQALASQGLSDEQAETLRVARASAGTLTQLLDELLDAARAETDAFSVRPQSIELRPLLQEVADAWRSAAAHRGLAFVTGFADALPDVVVCDPLRVKQVLTNLLSNACKYTEAGQVRLDADLDARGRLRLRVSDTGPGLPADARARLFQPFAPGEPARPVPEGRSGLGLSICARLVGLMDGEIAIESDPTTGTRVTVNLPLAAPAAPPIAGPAQVLVCDDDATSRLLLAQMLRRRGFDVIEAADGAGALELWRRLQVRALVTDLEMEGLDGLSLIRRIRDEEGERAARTLIVVCSGALPPAGSGPGAQADAFLAKPLKVETLAATLHALGL